MHDLHRVQRIGHLGLDPEVTYTATGTAHHVQRGNQPAMEGCGRLRTGSHRVDALHRMGQPG